jgi:hypothetical protein
LILNGQPDVTTREMQQIHIRYCRKRMQLIGSRPVTGYWKEQDASARGVLDGGGGAF